MCMLSASVLISICILLSPKLQQQYKNNMYTCVRMYMYVSQLVDNTDLWGGSLIGSVVFDDPDEMFFISGALK